jgi:hypothetical protein
MKYKAGKMYAVKFQDHAINCSAITCCASGTLVKQDKKTITLAFWLPISESKDLVENNWEIVTIIKSTIIKALEIDF